MSDEPKKIDVDAEEKRAFPFGKIGDVRYDLDRNELVMIKECEVQPHEEGEEHEHIYLPSVTQTPWRTYRNGVVDHTRLIPLDKAEEAFRKQLEDAKHEE